VRADLINRALEPVRAGVMPDLRGLSARDALHLLTRIGMTASMKGDGFVVRQSPAAGTPLTPGDSCALQLERRPPEITAGASQ
jgi:beta-lactam-binding protein with PASTA domain